MDRLAAGIGGRAQRGHARLRRTGRGGAHAHASRKTPAAEGSEEEAFSFARSISIPESVQSEKVTAAFENGVLLVTLPKREEAKPRKVTIEVK